MEIEKNKIRFLFYISTTSIVLILVVLLSFISVRSFNQLSADHTTQLRASIYDMKKIYIKDLIDRTIQDIDIERDLIISTEAIQLEKIESKIDSITETEYTIDELFSYLLDENLIPSSFELVSYDMNTQELYQSIHSDFNMNLSLSTEAFQEYFSNYPVKKELKIDQYLIIIGVSDTYIENHVQYLISNRLRKERFVDNGYIWINYILDYNGGDDYAIRLVHPNLPETEGSYLSTNTEDTQGNKPYLTELQGINADGELYNDYFFKKMDSDENAHKLSYAKLYEPYDWVIATGVYIDDIDSLIASEDTQMIEARHDFINKTIIISILCAVMAIIIFYIFEKRISRLISNFQSILLEKNEEIKHEKELVEKIAYLDSLTGILNRRAMLTRIKEVYSSYNRYSGSFSIAIGDIDNFKRINDTYGHIAGDKVLVEIAKLFTQNLRQDDVVARWGGEEFLILLNNVDSDISFEKIDNIRKMVERMVVDFEGEMISVTISLGIATFKKNSSTYEQLIKEADENLYLAKSNGRNKVVDS